MRECEESAVSAVMWVHLDPTVDHSEVNNSVEVGAGQLSPRYELIYVALCHDRGRDGGAKRGDGDQRVDRWRVGAMDGGRGEVKAGGEEV